MEKVKSIIIMVDDSPTNLAMAKKTLNVQYDVITISSCVELMKILEIVSPDLILLDIEMPDMSGFDVIKAIKNKRETAGIPVIFLTSRSDKKSELKGLSLGAVDYIIKPFSPPLLRKRVELHLLIESQKKELKNYNENLQKMVEEKTQTVMELQNAILHTLAELVEYRDDVTGKHIDRMEQYLELMTASMADSEQYQNDVRSWDLSLLYQSAQLHDVGKIAIRDDILLKPGKLTPEEFDVMKTHTTFGMKVFQKIERLTKENSFLLYAKTIAGSHHERWDGSGYPNGIKGEDIPLQARLIAIVDVYDALTNERPYKRAFSHEEAVKIIKEGEGSHFDPKLVEIFLENEQKFKEILSGSRSDKESATGAVS